MVGQVKGNPKTEGLYAVAMEEIHTCQQFDQLRKQGYLWKLSLRNSIKEEEEIQKAIKRRIFYFQNKYNIMSPRILDLVKKVEK